MVFPVPRTPVGYSGSITATKNSMHNGKSSTNVTYHVPTNIPYPCSLISRVAHTQFTATQNYHELQRKRFIADNIQGSFLGNKSLDYVNFDWLQFCKIDPSLQHALPRDDFHHSDRKLPPCFSSQISNLSHLSKHWLDRPLSIHQNMIRLEPFRNYQDLIFHFSNCLSSNQILLILLLLMALGMTEEAHAESFSDGQLDRIYALLEKKPELRTTDEKIELFNYLLKKGEEEAKKAKDKNIVIFFGNTGAGKSTLINFLCGCKMIEDNRDVVVAPDSKRKEVALIGTKAISCTFIPRNIPDISEFHRNSDSITSLLSSRGTPEINDFYDMPGLSDNRGIEVALANAIIMKQIIENAKSVRFVMVFEHGQLKAERYQKWSEAIKLLEERFNNTLGRGKNSLCLVITKSKDDITTIKEDIKKYTEENPGIPNLSDHVIVYNPLNPRHKENVFEALLQTNAYNKLNIKISLSQSQLWEALQLGDKIQEGVNKHLEKGGNAEIYEAVKKIRFTYGISKLGNEGLIKLHESAVKAVQDHIKRITDNIDTRNAPPLKNQIEAFKNYEFLKENFSPFVDFDQPNKDVRVMIKGTKDPRWVAWNEPPATIVSTISTVALVAGGFAFPPLWAGAAVTGCAGVKAVWHWWKPSQEEKDMTSFFKGP